MFKNNSLTTRIAIGKLTGLLITLIGLFILHIFINAHLPLMIQIGIVLWYITFGAIIGLFGIFDPILDFSFKFPFRGIFIGAWLNFVIVFLAYNQLQEVMILVLGIDTFFQSPFWFVAEGAIVGCFIDYLATKFGGQGNKIEM